MRNACSYKVITQLNMKKIMNELKKRLTKFFYEATRVKSYIDFLGKLSKSEGF